MKSFIYNAILALCVMSFSLVAMDLTVQQELERVMSNIRRMPPRECPPALPYSLEIIAWFEYQQRVRVESESKKVELARQVQEKAAQNRQMLQDCPPAMNYVTKGTFHHEIVLGSVDFLS